MTPHYPLFRRWVRLAFVFGMTCGISGMLVLVGLYGMIRSDALFCRITEGQVCSD